MQNSTCRHWGTFILYTLSVCIILLQHPLPIFDILPFSMNVWMVLLFCDISLEICVTFYSSTFFPFTWLKNSFSFFYSSSSDSSYYITSCHVWCIHTEDHVINWKCTVCSWKQIIKYQLLLMWQYCVVIFYTLSSVVCVCYRAHAKLVRLLSYLKGLKMYL